MKSRYVGLAIGAMIVLGAMLSFPSCGHDQKLVSIDLAPTAVTYQSPNSDPAAFTAYGNYIHPPAKKDITAQVTWKTDTPTLFTFKYQAGTGELVAPDGGCGVGNVWATAPEGTGGGSNIIVSSPATLTVNDPTVPTCPGGGTQGTLSVQITPDSSGTVTSLTYGINCPSVSCIALVPAGTSVALTATPANGFSFLDWQGCTSKSGNSCLVTVPAGGAGVLATFQ